MENSGQIQNGAIVPDQPLTLPEGTRVQFALVSAKDVATSEIPRKGGQLNGQIQIADDFDILPSDIAESFGMESE